MNNTLTFLFLCVKFSKEIYVKLKMTRKLLVVIFIDLILIYLIKYNKNQYKTFNKI